MKFRIWLRVYQHQLADPITFKPFPSMTYPGDAQDGSKVLAFDAEVPDDLFGIKAVDAIPVDAPADSQTVLK